MAVRPGLKKLSRARARAPSKTSNSPRRGWLLLALDRNAYGPDLLDLGRWNSWTNVAPRVQGIATFNSATRLAVPDSAIDPIGANNLAIAGIAANGTDGLVYMGTAGIRLILAV
jgi:hypothetical protein